MMRTGAWLPMPLLLGACAQVGQLSGGAPDERPPQLVAANPAPFSTGFIGDRITLEFDERIQLDRPRDRMLVSPPLAEPPSVRLSGPRSLTIGLNAPLAVNTTYVFGIGEAVKDLTEGNVAGGLQYVISTGNHVDSLMLAGSVEDAFSGQPEKDVLVLLFHEGDDIRTGRPAHATRSDASGRFALTHLREGRYRLHALRDLNANYRFDLPNESVAFLDQAVALLPGDSLAPPVLRLFQEKSAVQRLLDVRVTADGAFRIVTAKPVERVRVRDVARTGGRLEWTVEPNPTRDTLLLWPSDTTALGEGRYELTLDPMVVDTLRHRPTERMPHHTGVQAQLVSDEDPATIRVRAARPIRSFDPRLFRVLRDSSDIAFSVVRDTTDTRTLLVRTALPAGSSALLMLLPKAITDIFGGSNDTLRTGIGRLAEAGTAVLRVRLALPPVGDGFLLQLMDAQGRTMREAVLASGQEEVVWARVPPGMYTLRLVHDRNGNGRWDTGELATGTQPERVWRYVDKLNLRAAWDLKVDWRPE